MTTVLATVTSPIIAQHLQALATLDQSRVPGLRVITSANQGYIDTFEKGILAATGDLISQRRNVHWACFLPLPRRSSLGC